MSGLFRSLGFLDTNSANLYNAAVFGLINFWRKK